MYKQLPYRLHNDIRVYRDTRRCVRPMYDKKDGRTSYTVASMESIRTPTPLQSTAKHERWVSLLCVDKREPYMLELYYEIKEKELNELYHTLGIKVQIYSIMNAINVTTKYMMQLVGNEPRKWKRIMVTYHVSEEPRMLPHVVDEMVLDEDDMKCYDTDKPRLNWWSV